jgi:mRNA-degrading endonuclease RelE of RelBE toxin-antitoxin system
MKKWDFRLHSQVDADLGRLGKAEAKRVLKVVYERTVTGEPERVGKPLRGRTGGLPSHRVGRFADRLPDQWHRDRLGGLLRHSS